MVKKLSKVQRQNYLAKLNRDVIRLCNSNQLRPDHAAYCESSDAV